ncbi:TIM21-domain-containing protein [Lipomyces oligophaga]|uniref:TIM21-domain-containing protein n=1 Tax=Lipomyces oligophaga TaxID=45792 RepID=UPI0034CD02F3
MTYRLCTKTFFSGNSHTDVVLLRKICRTMIEQPTTTRKLTTIALRDQRSRSSFLRMKISNNSNQFIQNAAFNSFNFGRTWVGVRPGSVGRDYATYTETGHSGKRKSTESNISFIQKLAQFTARSASYLFYSSIVIVGLGFTGLAVYYFVTTAILPTGDVQLQNRAERLISEHPECIQVLGDKLSFYGESSNRWARNRPASITRGIDQHNVEHTWMRFFVMGDKNIEGTVIAELLKSKDGPHFDFRYLTVTVGEKRIAVIEDPKFLKRKSSSGGHTIEFMGLQIWPIGGK